MLLKKKRRKKKKRDLRKTSLLSLGFLTYKMGMFLSLLGLKWLNEVLHGDHLAQSCHIVITQKIGACKAYPGSPYALLRTHLNYNTKKNHIIHTVSSSVVWLHPHNHTAICQYSADEETAPERPKNQPQSSQNKAWAINQGLHSVAWAT